MKVLFKTSLCATMMIFKCPLWHGAYQIMVLFSSRLSTCLNPSHTHIVPLYLIILQVVKVHQNSVDTYLETIILDSVDNTADAQARMEISDMAERINDVAYDMEDK